MPTKFYYPLLENAFSNDDINKAMQVLKSRYITMSKKTKEFEKYFAKKLKSRHALMVNSGSSAVLLAFALLTNIKRKRRLKKNDEVLVPAVCWSTTFWPIIQCGLKPKFIDVDLKTYSPSFEIIEKNITNKTKAIVLVNVLGNCSEMDKIKKLLDKKGIMLIEDNCESLGSKYKGKYLGTFGEVGAFSFYYSHQITSGEGGAVICKNDNDYKILCELRAHGWDRDYNQKNRSKFNFVNQGYNLRPLDLTAAIALNQFKRLSLFKNTRAFNRNAIIKTIKKSNTWNNQFNFFEPIKGLDPSWFGFPLLIDEKLINKKKSFLQYLKKHKIETRPIISGNFTKQECIKNHKFKITNIFKEADRIEKLGFFIGLPTKRLKQNTINELCRHLLNISNL